MSRIKLEVEILSGVKKYCIGSENEVKKSLACYPLNFVDKTGKEVKKNIAFSNVTLYDLQKTIEANTSIKVIYGEISQKKQGRPKKTEIENEIEKN